MSIAAKISAVTVVLSGNCGECNNTGKGRPGGWDDCPRCHGTSVGKRAVRLHLEPREKGGLAGQPVLTIVDPPDVDFSGLVGSEIWGNSRTVLIGDMPWAERLGSTRIKLLEPPTPSV